MNLLPDDITQIAPGNDGYVPRDWSEHPLGGTGFAGPFNLPEYKRTEWKDRIVYLKEGRRRIADICAVMGVKPKNQGRTNTCWAYGVTMGQEIGNALDGKPHESLSPASIAAYVTGFRDVGGWCAQALEQARIRGWATEKRWPGTAVTSRKYAAEAEIDRVKHRATHWLDLEPRNVSQVNACLLRDRPIPVPLAFNRIRHVMTAIEVVELPNGGFGWLCWNSGYLRDANGLTTVPFERWGGPDEALSLAVGTAG